MRLRSNVFAVAMMFMTALPLAAQDHQMPNPERQAARTELRDVLSTWAHRDVIPKVLEWKRMLDGAMSAEDLDALNRLRERAGALRTEFTATVLEMRLAWLDEDYDALKAGRDRMKEFGKARRAIFEELKPIAIRYRSTLEAIGTEARPQTEKWRAEGKALAQQWAESHKDVVGDMPLRHMWGGIPGLGRMDGEMRRKVMVARFMLWDGGRPAYSTDDEEDFDLPALK